MAFWLLNLIHRIASGEPYRKANQRELRFFSAIFASIPVWVLLIFLFSKAEQTYLHKAGTSGICLYWAGGAALIALWIAAWVKFIPPAVSWAVAAAAWIVMIVLDLAGKLGF
jgi:ABC-type dipeptide/oligopeptide/nickel transport system permease component